MTYNNVMTEEVLVPLYITVSESCHCDSEHISGGRRGGCIGPLYHVAQR